MDNFHADVRLSGVSLVFQGMYLNCVKQEKSSRTLPVVQIISFLLLITVCSLNCCHLSMTWNGSRM